MFLAQHTNRSYKEKNVLQTIENLLTVLILKAHAVELFAHNISSLDGTIAFYISNINLHMYWVSSVNSVTVQNILMVKQPF